MYLYNHFLSVFSWNILYVTLNYQKLGRTLTFVQYQNEDLFITVRGSVRYNTYFNTVSIFILKT